ncbi:MAG: DAK2 domain-containing protein [Firmicutes bacterium]|nr:DAK2 domain-containing protein [Bacillota bacterium]
MELTRFNGEVYRAMLRVGQYNLEAHRSEVDALNVFPVPDGDTGTNMMLTLRSAVKEVENLKTDNLAAVAKAASTGSMMGARGNSGVILSQLLRGIAQSLEGKTEAGASELAEAYQMGVKTAYKAVMKPIEGTILTVARESARAAADAARHENRIGAVLEAAIETGKEALIHTPELLPVLRKAGVVDAGGKGLILILEGMQQGVMLWQEGKPIAVPETAEETGRLHPVPAVEVAYPTEELIYTYCTETIIQGQDIFIAALREKLSSMGDSMVVAGSEELARVHIHTNHPGQVLETCLEFGTIHKVKIDNMKEQHQHLLEAAALADDGPVPGAAAVENIDDDVPPVVTGVVAVAPGEGMAEILRSLGVEQVVEGGQSMNPSIENLVKAIDQVSTDQVLVLPNNSNVILAAEQARDLTAKSVKVLPSKSFPQAVAAMIAHNPNAPLDENYTSMLEGMGRVRCGEVTYAVRDSVFDGTEIKNGQIIGLEAGRIKVVGESPTHVVEELLRSMVASGDELISLYWGSDVTEDEADEAADNLRAAFPQAEIEAHYGGQPLYYYVISVE